MSAPVTQTRDLVLRLLDEGKMTPLEVSESLGGRVSSRTIYRWAKGESYPQNASDFNALQTLVESKLGTRHAVHQEG